MAPLRYQLIGAAVVAGTLVLGSQMAGAAGYRTARALFHDCSAEKGSDRRQSCAESLHTLYNNWQLEQGDRVCSRVTLAVLPDAYVAYWRERGLGFLSGAFRSAITSVNDFLDSEAKPCPRDESKLPH